MKAVALLFSLFLLTAVLAQDAPVGDAAGILRSLVLESEASLDDLSAYWTETHPLLQEALGSVQQAHREQDQECNTKSGRVDDLSQELDNCYHYIDWISNKINENLRRVTELEENRCDQSKLYINGLKHNKIALKLIPFLRQAIQSKETLSLAQKKDIFTRLSLFMEMYKNHQIKELLQKQIVDDGEYDVETNTEERARTDEEIGTGHVDRGGDNITVSDFQSSGQRSWPQYKAEILELLDNLEADIQSQMERAQDDEMSAGISLAEFKIQVEKENQELDRFLYEEVERHGRIQNQIRAAQEEVEQCQSELETVAAELATSTAQYNEQVQNYSDQRQKLMEEIETFRYVLGLYNTHLSGSDQEYRDRITDIVGDGSADSSYGTREIDQIDFANM